ncbi:MAG: tRNA wybutosine-synthesizing 3 family protein [Parcubacteria group bacterium]|jgi:tRNA wybutosine-synthesizing protein 3
MFNKFANRKNDVLEKKDKSFIGEWDEPIKELCDEINTLQDYYTTSSCSGRILLMIDQDKKAPGLFLNVWHHKISVEELKKALAEALKCRKNIKFKMEACALHIACKRIEEAERIYTLGKNSSWKKSGIISAEDNFVVELNSSEKLEFPIVQKGKILVDDEFLKIIVEDSNNKLERGWQRIKKLKENMRELA